MMKQLEATLRIGILCALMMILLTGCRMRIIEDPALADVLLERPEQEQQEEIPELTDLRAEQVPEPVETEAEEELPPEESAEIRQQDPVRPSSTAPTARPGTSGPRSNQGSKGAAEQPSVGITVTFDARGGEPASVKKTVKYQEPYGSLPEVEQRGHVFLGWFTAAKGGTQIQPDTKVEKQDDHTLYAQWRSKRTCTVTLDPGEEGRLSSKDRKLEISDGDHYGTLPVPVRDGYDFLGWTREEGGGEQVLPDMVFEGEEDQTLYAQWEYNPMKYWSYMLLCVKSDVYACQRKSAYYESGTDHVTASMVPLLIDTSLENVAKDREDPNTTDDWVEAKFPYYVIKCAGGSLTGTRDELKTRFPKSEPIAVDSRVLTDEVYALYAKLELLIHAYPEFVREIDLAKARQELGVASELIAF